MCSPSGKSEPHAWEAHSVFPEPVSHQPWVGDGLEGQGAPRLRGPTLPWHGWLQKEEELRKEEERKKALDERLRFEQERMEQERQEQEERERRYREREQQIEEHRCAQPHPAAGPALCRQVHVGPL